MLISSIEPVFSKKHRLRVRLLEGTGFILYKKEVDKYDLREGEEISEDLYHTLLQDIFIPRARMRALHLLVKQDRSEKGLRDKLIESGYPSEAVEEAIRYVSEYGYIDDIRFCEGYIRSHRTRHSKRRILYDLEQKGIARDVIEQAIEMMEEEEAAFNDIAIIQKKSRGVDISDQKSYNRLYTGLLRAGFSPEDICSVLKDFCDCALEDSSAD